MKNVKKIIVAFILMLCFLNVQANDEDDQTIIVQGVSTYLGITAKAGNENTIVYVRMYNLGSPNQFNKILDAETCTENDNTCIYYVENSTLVEGAVYRIELYISGSETPFVVQYIH